MPESDVVATYDPYLGVFLRTFKIRYTHNGILFELPINAATWREAEAMLASIKADGVVFSVLLAKD